MNFSGSYDSADVTFLLKPLSEVDLVEVGDKERLIQSGARHYSEMLTPEQLPSARYLEIYRHACARNLGRMAQDTLALAALIGERRSGPITLVSLARAGTPVGVVLQRLLSGVFGRACTHYSVSIVRGRGLDAVALRYIVARHAPESLVFVDGWTGKGVIARELAASVARFNAAHGTRIDAGLYVLADLAGSAACAASGEDYLIPSSILNATVSGLVSRTVLNAAIGPDDFHGCVVYREFAPHDQSRSFADALTRQALALAQAPAVQALDRARAQAVSQRFLEQAGARYGIADANLIKPGIGEATRVLLRRSPRLLVLRDPLQDDVRHLRLLAEEKHIPVETDPELPYHAVSLIRSAIDG